MIGNVTGFVVFECSMCGKWLELLKQIAPGVTRAAALRDPASPSGTGQFGGGQTGRHTRRRCIERAVVAFARSPNGGLIVTPGIAARLHPDAQFSTLAPGWFTPPSVDCDQRRLAKAADWRRIHQSAIGAAFDQWISRQTDMPSCPEAIRRLACAGPDAIGPQADIGG